MGPGGYKNDRLGMDSSSRPEVAAREGSFMAHLLSHLSRWFRQFVRIFSRQPQADANDAPAVVTAPLRETSLSATVYDLVKSTNELLLFEAQHGCTGQVESMLADIRRRYLDGSLLYSNTPAEDVAIEQVWINLLRLGMLDDLLDLIKRAELPFPSEISRFLEYCRRQYDVCRERGAAVRAQHPNCDLFMMGCIVWGEEYINNFLQYNFRSMLSEGNLPSLKRQGPVIFSIVTDGDGERRMRRHPLFASMSDIGPVEFTVISDDLMAILRSGHLVRNFYILYGMLDHCSIYLAQAARSHLFMIPVDSIVADGSLSNMANYRRYGFECCGGGNIVAETESFLPALDACFGRDGPICISTADLATLAAEHAHHYFRSQIVAFENQDFGKHPRELFWPVEGGVEIHSVFIHPLFTSASALQRYARRHFANIDYGMIPRMFTDSCTIKIIEDPREAYVNNFTARNRLYETTARPFAAEDFLSSHEKYSYSVQRSLFIRAQALPCRLNGWTPFRNVDEDVRQIDALLCTSGMGAP
jgi:hypothetical protein